MTLSPEMVAAAARAMQTVCDGGDRWNRLSDEVKAQWIESALPVVVAAMAVKSTWELKPEPRDADVHAHAPDEHHELARQVWEFMNRRSAPGICMTMAYTGVLRALIDRAGGGV